MGKLNEWLEVNDVIENVGNYAEEAIQNDDNETVLSDLYGDKILVSQDCTEDDIRECFGINSKEDVKKTGITVQNQSTN